MVINLFTNWDDPPSGGLWCFQDMSIRMPRICGIFPQIPQETESRRGKFDKYTIPSL